MKAITIRSTSAHRRHVSSAGSKLFFLIIFLIVALCSFAQTASYLDFRNPVLQSGTAGADGAEYRFSNVTSGIDAIVTITRRSDALVNMLNPDMNTSGFDGAFQPQVGYNNGTAPGAADWWMEFQIRFVDAGTANPAVIAEFNVSGVDIDGNSQYINEYVSFYDMHDYALETGSVLSVTNLYEDINGTMLSGRRFDGPVANYTNIDTSARGVMVTNRYVSKSVFTVRTGGRSTDVSGASDRMYSLYFQNFSYNMPATSLLALNNNRIGRTRIAEETSVRVFPNPSTGLLKFRLPTEWLKEKLSVRVLDVKGNVVQSVASGVLLQSEVDLRNLTPGVYMLHVMAGSYSTIQRIVKI